MEKAIYNRALKAASKIITKDEKALSAGSKSEIVRDVNRLLYFCLANSIKIDELFAHAYKECQNGQ